MAVYIRGLAFKCTSGSRREQVLLALAAQDETWDDPYGIAILAGFVGMVIGALGVVTFWWLT